MKELFLDTECYKNYFLIVFKNMNNKKVEFILDENNKLNIPGIIKILSNYLTIGFNSRLYDMPLIIAATRGYDYKNIKRLSDSIILKEDSIYNILCKYDLWSPREFNHIDIMRVLPGLASLKMYGARINFNKLQDLPYDPVKVLDEYEKEQLRKYCENDVDITIALYKELKEQLDIRGVINKEYDVDVRSKSDAQIAEVLFNRYSTKHKNIERLTNFKYSAPDYIKFNRDEFNNLFKFYKEIEFEIDKDNNFISKNVDIEKIKIGNLEYKCGIGGIHSCEEKQTIICDSEHVLLDIDVISYYPSIILNNKYYPCNFDKDKFINFYSNIYQERIKAKANNDNIKSNIYKIILNGSFGKFGDKYSVLYSPNLLINTTITGQLSLLMLIEKLDNLKFKVVSANTDGIIVYCNKSRIKNLEQIVTSWENYSNFKTTKSEYSELYSQSVNNYIAIKDKKVVKTKGVFTSGKLEKNPPIKICVKAIIEYLTNNIPIENTIKSGNKLDYLLIRKVNDGAYYKGEYLGKVIRWYWSKNGDVIVNKSNHKVSNSQYGKPIMNLNSEMDDIHYDIYIQHTIKLLKSLGVEYKC